MEKNQIELLSPVGSLEGVRVAINNGADAVYLGAKDFNARAKTTNLTFEELQQATDYAHFFGKKVYLTLNTILNNEDFSSLYDFVKNAVKCKVDAFIVQDLGVITFMQKYFKGVEIHASTQLAIHNLEGALMSKELGLKRVVLSRETPLSEIKKIHDNCDIELEYFIQGALCVCFSGNCYLSAHMFNESGNKGRCLQLCRLPYTAYKDNQVLKKGYLLSAKDFNMSKRLKDLRNAGIISFKIEGRARRIGYCAVVTNTYRKIFDNLDKENSNNNSESLSNLKKAFNRGDFTEGYLNGNDNIIYDKIQGHLGEEIGKVTGFSRGAKFNTIKMKLNVKLSKGDGIKILRGVNEITSFSAIDIKEIGNETLVTGQMVAKIGDSVRLILDTNLENQTLLASKKQKVDVCVLARPSENIKLMAGVGDITVEVTGDKAEFANSQPATMQSVFDSVSKMGDTDFAIGEFMAILGNVFIRKQSLNALRREALEKLKEKLIENYNQRFNDIEVLPYNLNSIQDEISEYITKNCMPKDLLNLKSFQVENDLNNPTIIENNAIIWLNNILFSKDIEFVKNELQKYLNKNVIVIANNISHFNILKNINFKGQIIAGPMLNICNRFSLLKYIKMGASGVILSPETPEAEYEYFKDLKFPIYKSTFNNFPLMTFVHCPIKNLFGNNCSNCKYAEGITYKMESGQEFVLKKVKLANCYFNLYKKVDGQYKMLYTFL